MGKANAVIVQVFLCATAATSAGGFYEPVDNVKARPFYKSPPHESEYEYHPHPEYKAEESYKPVHEPPEHAPQYKPIEHAPVPEYQLPEHVSLPAYKPIEHVPFPVYKPIEHVTEPVYKVPVYKVPEYAPSLVYKHEASQPGYHHEQASSFQNVAYKVTQQAYREAEHKPHNSPLYR